MNTEKALNILELESNATAKDIKKAYRRLAMMYHPDRNPGVYTQHQFIEISEAYEFLNSKRTFSSEKIYNKNPRNKFRNQNHRSHYYYKSYHDSKDAKSQRAKEAYDKEFAEQSDILYHKLFNKYKKSYQRKISILVAIIGIIICSIFSYDYFTPTNYKTHNFSNKNIIKKQLAINIDAKSFLAINIDSKQYTISFTELQNLKKQLSQNRNFDFAFEETGFLHNKLDLYIVDNIDKQIICKLEQGPNINNFIFLIYILMLIPIVGLIFEKPTFNFVFFIINYNIYVFPLILAYIIYIGTPLFS